MKKIMYSILLLVLVWGTAAHAAVITKTIPYQDGDTALEGFLAYDDRFSGKRPAVLVVHEWWGLNDYARSRAEMLARLGYVAFALDLYGKGKVTQHPEQAGKWMQQINQNIDLWRQRAQAGLEVLKTQPQADPQRMAAIGYCFGGATVQQLAYSGAQLRGVVSFHGSPIPPDPAEIGQVKAKILICHGAADPFTKPEQLQQYLEAMTNSGLDWQMIFYSNARHSFTNPGADKVGMAALKYDRDADQRSWKHMQVFFEQNL